MSVQHDRTCLDVVSCTCIEREAFNELDRLRAERDEAIRLLQIAHDDAEYCSELQSRSEHDTNDYTCEIAAFLRKVKERE